MNKNYTNSWIEDFDESGATNYHNKFFTRWEKNIKHKQQIRFIKNFFKKEMYWCDCPIGSGRLFDAIKGTNVLGYDLSPAFIELNRQKGIKCIKGDLFDIPFKNEFDFITSLHTLFAFDKFRDILQGYIKSLKLGGILIVDITNKNHIERTNKFAKYPYKSPMFKKDIFNFFETNGCKILKIIPHDFWDSYYLLNWRENKKVNKYYYSFKVLAWHYFNKLYFKISFLYNILSIFEKTMPDFLFPKYLVAVQKIKHV